jgi:hypothetical protein
MRTTRGGMQVERENEREEHEECRETCPQAVRGKRVSHQVMAREQGHHGWFSNTGILTISRIKAGKTRSGGKNESI